MSKFFYEARPFFYGVLSFYALVLSRNSILMIASGVLILGCCLWISAMRIDNRSQIALQNRKVSARRAKKDQEADRYEGHNKYHLP